MKRYLVPLLVCVFMIAAVSTGYAVPLPQESSTSGSDITGVFDAIGAFSGLVSAGIEAAGTQLSNGGFQNDPELPSETALPEPETSGQTDQVPAESGGSEEPVIGMPPEPEPEPAAEPEPEVPLPGEKEAPRPEDPSDPGETVPDDPESLAVPTEIEVSEFYNQFKRNLKALGRHSVSFEEKGGRNASRIDIDGGDSSILLHYEKARDGNLIDRITWNGRFADEDQRNNAETVFITAVTTLCSELDLDCETAGMFEAALDGKSGMTDGLLYYGAAEDEDGISGLTVDIYYTGN